MFRNGAYAKVWEVTEKVNSNTGKTKKQIRITISRKNEDNSYTQEFSGFVRLVGDAAKKTINNGDFIKLVNVGVTNTYNKEKNTTYVNYLCFDVLTANEIEQERANRGGVDIDNQPPMPKTEGNPPASAPTAKENPQTPVDDDDAFMSIPDGIDDNDLPFA